MIRIQRPQEPPAILRGQGRRLRRRLCAAYARSTEEYQRRGKVFIFDKGVFAAPEVKAALIVAQHGKCCFCESRITHVSFGDIEHFRPKAGYRQAEGEPLQTPGYYWLAYEWDNLLFCCELCNRRHKESRFPLAEPARRARCHRDACSQEQPLFIDPSAVEPAHHISFREEYPYPVEGDVAGQLTIQALGLDSREPLIEQRRDRLRMLRSFFDLSRCGDTVQMREEAAAWLLRYTADSAEYAAMARAALVAWTEAEGAPPPRRPRRSSRSAVRRGAGR